MTRIVPNPLEAATADVRAPRRSDFDYELPFERIAQHPLAERSAARMLHLASGGIADTMVRELPGLLRPGDLLVFNDTRVIPARIHGVKESGGRIEVFVERLLGGQDVLAQIRASKTPREAAVLHLEGGVDAEVLGREGEFFRLRFRDPRPAAEVLALCGHVPLPPYITRPDGGLDRERYQTVFAAREGAVAAPTAGLHFDDAMLEALERAGVERAAVTLHVGAGTFQPVREEDLGCHRMHAEWVEVPAATCAAVAAAKARGARVIAIGTTVVRALESAAARGELEPFRGETSLFITPGYHFRVIDMMLTNFHMPCSTLLMLVCAFGGAGRVLDAYRHAIDAGYRFYSYGDAMLVEP
ncbi:MAG: tRNA preQ1(34) S-adenosylmethionine ribosyltransferase-isomerase QueA [Gammaproteobacteria bacterium]|jgi:S-adenosylmethionine:tRNA ribosyltransferase-isomerase|nr:tRNA preQ1(34) S-adenosylmethionine ribosyltransferase-isomerase QueA [Gammaproteobacteria bacterium]